jgi:hypothetical protein
MDTHSCSLVPAICSRAHLHTTRRLNLSCSSDRCCMTDVACSYVMWPWTCTTAMMSGDCCPALQKNWLNGEMHCSLSFATCENGLSFGPCNHRKQMQQRRAVDMQAESARSLTDCKTSCFCYPRLSAIVYGYKAFASSSCSHPDLLLSSTAALLLH